VVPSRGLFGYRNEFLSDTRGEASCTAPCGLRALGRRARGTAASAPSATEPGQTTAYALFHIQERADLLRRRGRASTSQVVGASRRAGDLNVTVARARSSPTSARPKDEATIPTPARPVAIEWALGWIADDELLEVTPQSLRLRKKVLASNLRKRG
jgi:GTP-binding protein